jgi:hypothetical protein
VNTIAIADARARVGDVPAIVEWYDNSRDVPALLRPHLDGGMAEGVAWKLAPVRMFPDRHELSLDNDCILWDLPDALARWLSRGDECLLAEDVVRAFGRLDAACGPRPANTGIRGFPPGYDHEAAMRRVLEATGAALRSELDEQGLQVAAIQAARATGYVTVDEVSICSPVPPHRPALGRCGVHFVGINRRQPWCEVDGRPITELVRAHWRRLRPAVVARLDG